MKAMGTKMITREISLAVVHALFHQMPVDVFEHNDGVVNNDTDSERQP